MTPTRKPPIGFDPVAWVSRLRDVNEGSQFSENARALIEQRLKELQRLLDVNREVTISPEDLGR